LNIIIGFKVFAGFIILYLLLLRWELTKWLMDKILV
jgi:hypothetical protein